MGGRARFVTIARTKQRRDTAIWLLKKGHLRVAAPPSSVRTSAM
jgi:hypothetical protein